MNQKIDTSETLRIQETKDGYTLIIIKQVEIKLKIEDGKVLNKLSKRQMEFVKVHI